jgi:hypothetical protein
MFAKKWPMVVAMLWVLSVAACSPTRYYRVESDPPGAHVVNPDGTLVCNTRCQATCTVQLGFTNTLKAMPTRTQDCSQTTTFACENMPSDPGQAKTLFFDMKVCPINRSLTGTMSGE